MKLKASGDVLINMGCDFSDVWKVYQTICLVKFIELFSASIYQLSWNPLNLMKYVIRKENIYIQ